MKIVNILLAVLWLQGCGGEEAGADNVAEIAWRLNYRDWSKPHCEREGGTACTDDAFHGCDNASTATGGPAAAAIAKIRVTLSDEFGQTPPFEREIDCDRGTHGKRLGVRGILRQSYLVVVEAVNAGGEVLYRYPTGDQEVSVDLSTFQVLDLELQSTTGEFNFTATFGGAFSCPSTVQRLRWSVIPDGGGDPVAAGSMGACDAMGTVNELWLRYIPFDYTRVTVNSAPPTPYTVRVEAAVDDASPALHCGDSVRTLFPGDNNLRTDMSMAVGPCP